MNEPVGPSIRIELEYIKASLKHAFSAHQKAIAPLIDEAIERAIQPEAITGIIDHQARKYVNDAIEKEIRNFFLYGNGHKAIKTAVQQMLEESKPHA